MLFLKRNLYVLGSHLADLPEPRLPSLGATSTLLSTVATKPAQSPVSPPPVPVAIQSHKPRTVKKETIDFPEADPWGSPDLHRGHEHISTPVRTNGTLRETAPREPIRTTSNFTTSSAGSNGTSKQSTTEASSAPTTGGWGTYDGTSDETFSPPIENPIGGDGFGDQGGGDGGPAVGAPTRSFGGGRVPSGVEENIVVTLLPEKEGVFMFQHHNYHVSSARRGSKVVRRYSDFVWLLDCLQKRFPFRHLPLLPPKRVGGELPCRTLLSLY